MAESPSPPASIRQGIDPRTQPSFSLANRLARVAWGFADVLLVRWTPRPCHAWRRLVLIAFGAKIGAGAHIYGGVRIWAPWNLIVGDRAGIAPGATLYNMAIIEIGADAVISQGAHLCTGSHDYTDPDFQLYAKPIRVGAKAWLCAECFIGPGVSIGEGAVAGARAVLFRDAEPWTIYSGNPAKPVKQRQLKNPQQIRDPQ